MDQDVSIADCSSDEDSNYTFPSLVDDLNWSIFESNDNIAFEALEGIHAKKHVSIRYFFNSD